MSAETLQDTKEIQAFVDIIKEIGAKSYLEIGSKFGGSIERVGKAMPKGSTIVAVDMPKGTKAWPQSRISLERVMDDLKRDGHKTRIVWGDSQTQETVDIVRMLGPFDAIFIDADHRLPGVMGDWNNYGPMANMVVAFHDIGWRRANDWVGTRIDVPEFWNSIKSGYTYKEFKFCSTGKNNGIGVIFKDGTRETL